VYSGFFDRTMHDFPAEREAIQRLRAFLSRAPVDAEYTFAHLYSRAQPSSPEAFALVLDRLRELGALARVYRIHSPATGGGIGDYDSVQQIPSRLFDPYSDDDLIVTPDLVRPIFTPLWSASERVQKHA
jgi:hypothetical protein